MKLNENLLNDTYYDFQNIIHSMAKESITALNILIESIEIGNIETLKMIDPLKEDLNYNQIMIDDLAFSFLLKNKDLNINRLWKYVSIANIYEQIGLTCLSIKNHICLVIDFIDDSFCDVADILLLFKRVHNLLLNVSTVFFDQSISFSIQVKDEYFILEKYKDILMNRIIDSLENNNGLSFIFSEFLFMIQRIFEIGSYSLDIYQKIIL